MNSKRNKLDIEEAERQRIAKDLHDSVGQQLSAIKLYLSTLKIMSPETYKAKYKALITKSISAVDEASIDLSNICYNLMPTTLNTYGLVKGVNELARKINLSKKIKINFVSSPKCPSFDSVLDKDLFRIIQEFINNSIKHSKAKQIDILIKHNKKSKDLTILLKDDGIGFDINEKYKPGMGLLSVKSRVDFHNGVISIGSSSYGTVYEICVPVKNKYVL